MNAIKTVNILDSIIPISRFNKGESNRIFNEVKTDGSQRKAVLKAIIKERIQNHSQKVGMENR